MDKFYDEEWNKRIEEHFKQYKEEHTLRVTTSNGNTYITYKTNDYINRELENYIWKLLQLMDVGVIVYNGIDEWGLAIEGDDPERAAFIQKFIDDGYKLKWK